jgi:hypothetical protein
MELFLNILWVVIALGALCAWRVIWKRQEHRTRREPLQEWTAFVCALVFVFFAVSLSDDLQAAAILSDDCARGWHHSLSWNCGHAREDNARLTRASAAGVWPQAIFPALRMISLIVPASVLPGCNFAHELSSGRAPPFVSL